MLVSIRERLHVLNGKIIEVNGRILEIENRYTTREVDGDGFYKPIQYKGTDEEDLNELYKRREELLNEVRRHASVSVEGVLNRNALLKIINDFR